MLQEVLKRDSSYWLAAYNLGYLHYQSGQPAAAEAPLRLATQLNPQDADGLALLARALFRLGRIEEGVKAIQRAIDLRPRAPGYHFALGVMLREAGQREAAARALRQELEIQPDSEPARRLLAELEAGPSAPRPSR
jgi:Flp pilus assembly protein TadD